jgi:hypothetical protein
MDLSMRTANFAIRLTRKVISPQQTTQPKQPMFDILEILQTTVFCLALGVVLGLFDKLEGQYSYNVLQCIKVDWES